MQLDCKTTLDVSCTQSL